jgi:voltage-gated sodium channel
MHSAIVRFVESPRFSTAVTIVVCLNALVLGIDTYGSLPLVVHDWCDRLDNVFVMLFVVELLLKLFAWRLRFFANAWNFFDLLVVVVSLVAVGPFSVLRTLRIFRTMRLVSAVPSMRRVVEALIRAIPGISAILGVLAVFFYVGAVLTTSLFGREFPEMFGTLGGSTITLFQLMLFDNWADVLRTVGDRYPLSPLFFIIFTVVSAFAVLNLFIAVMVDALRTEHDRLQSADLNKIEQHQKSTQREMDEVETAIRSLEAKVDAMMEKLDAKRQTVSQDGELL